MKILLVDDNSNNLYLLESLLNGTGYETTGASVKLQMEMDF